MRQRERCQLLRVSCVSFSFQNSPICKNEKVLPEKVGLPESSCFTNVSTILPPYMHSLQVSHNSHNTAFCLSWWWWFSAIHVVHCAG